MGVAGGNNPNDFNGNINTFFYMKMNPNIRYVNGYPNPFFVGGALNPNQNNNAQFMNNNNNMNRGVQFNNMFGNNQINNMNNNMNMFNKQNQQMNWMNNMNNINVNNSHNNNMNMFMNNLNNFAFNNNNNVKVNNFMGNNKNIVNSLNNNFNCYNNVNNNMNNNMNQMNNMNFNNNMNQMNNMNFNNSMNQKNNLNPNFNANMNQMNNMNFYPNNSNNNFNNNMNQKNNMNVYPMNNNNMNQMNNMNNFQNYNNMNQMNNMQMFNNNPQIFNNLNQNFKRLNSAQQSTINEVFNEFNRENMQNTPENNLRASQVDLNEEIKIKFRFLTGQCIEVKAKLGEIFYHVFYRFHEDQCPVDLKNYMCCAVHNSLPVDNKKSLFDNNIKDGDTLLFIKPDDTHKEKEVEEEIEEEEEESKEDEEETNKLIQNWIEEYKLTKLLSILNDIMELKKGEKLPDFKLKVKFNLESKEFKDFITKKFCQTGMKIKEHEHKLIYTKTNFDWNCNECKNNKSKSEPRFYCSQCDYNICNKCRKEKKYYKMVSIPSNATPSNKNIQKKFINYSGHEHKLVYCRTKRSGASGGWNCDKCKEENTNKTWTFYCTCCDFDFCAKCAKKNNLI